MSDNGSLTWDSNLDDHPYTWSTDDYYDIGYYRLRSRSLDDITIFEEFMRNLAWYWILSCIFESSLNWQGEVERILSDYEVAMTDWLDYIENTKLWHSWVEEL